MPRVHGLPRDELDRREDELAALMTTRFDEVAALATEAIGATQTAAASSAAASVGDLGIVPSRWSGIVENELVPYVAETYGSGALTIQLGIADTLPDDVRSAYDVPLVSDETAESYLARRRNFLTGVGDDLWVEMRQELAEGMRRGESVPQLGDRLRRAASLTRWKAEQVARTEVNGASNAGSYEQARATGIFTLKEWIDTSDGRTRPTHVAVGGTRIALTENFTVGGWSMPRPHDGPAGEVVNCRCTLAFDVAEICQLGTTLVAAPPQGCQGVETTNLTPTLPGETPGTAEYEITDAGQPVVPAIIYKKHPNPLTVAESVDGQTRIHWDGKQYGLQRQLIPGTWSTVEDLTKTKAYALVKGPGWVKPGSAKVKLIEKAVPEPDTPTPAAWTKHDAEAAIAHVPQWQREYVRGKFDLANLKWYNPAEKLFDKAVEIQQNLPELSLLDVLRIMDASLVKTDAPFEKKILKWLGTKQGKDHAGSKLDELTPDAGPPAATTTPKVPDAADIASQVADISQLNKFDKGAIYTHFKYGKGAQGTMFLDSKPEDLWDRLTDVAGQNNVTPLQALRVIDERAADLAKVPNGHLYEKKIVQWLQTTDGKAHVSGVKKPKPPAAKPQPKPVQPTPDVEDVLPVVRPEFTDDTRRRVEELARQVDPEQERYPDIESDEALRMQRQMLTDEGWTPAQRRDLHYYTTSAYGDINRGLRYARVPPYLVERIRNIQAGMRPVTRSFTARRGTRKEQFGLTNLGDLRGLVGKTVTDHGFFSTSVGGNAAFGGREIAVEVEVPKGTPAAYIDHISAHQGEREVLLAAGTRFKVLGVELPNLQHESWLVRLRVLIP